MEPGTLENILNLAAVGVTVGATLLATSIVVTNIMARAIKYCSYRSDLKRYQREELTEKPQFKDYLK